MHFHTSIFLGLLISLFCFSCQTVEQRSAKTSYFGEWSGFFLVHAPDHQMPTEIPFRMSIKNDSTIQFSNDNELIQAKKVVFDGDSLSLTLPVFGSTMHFKLDVDTLRGEWINHAKSNYNIPIVAAKKNAKEKREPESIASRWKIVFSPDEDPGHGILSLHIDSTGKALGTVRTETGDYRFLEGEFDGSELFLSAFDGAHVFFLKANYTNNALKGGFWSGKHWYEDWKAEPDEDFQLRDPDSLTFLSAPLAFQFPNQYGDTVRLSDSAFNDKVIIVQITGSWCPNCMDETRVLVDLYDHYQSKGLEVIAIDFERTDDFKIFQDCVRRLREDLDVRYEILFGGIARKKEAAKQLPMLNHIMSYPTMILLDKNRQVKRIHTGFNGPSTGELYDDFIRGLQSDIESLLTDK